MTYDTDHPWVDETSPRGVWRVTVLWSGLPVFWRGIVFGLGFSGLLCIIDPANLQAKSASAPTLADQIEKEKQALSRIQDDIEAEQARYRAAKEAEERLRSKMEAAARRSDDEGRTVGQIDAKVKAAEAERTALDLKIAQQNQLIEAKKTALAKGLRRLYKERAGDSLSAILSPQHEARGARQQRHLAAIARVRRDRLVADRRERSHLADRKAAADRAVEHLAGRRAAAMRKVTAIQAAQQKASVRLALAQREVAESRNDLIALNMSAAQIQKVLKRLNELKAARPPQAAGSFASAKGHLVWPNNGKVIGLFGRQKHPKFDTYIDRKGIEIARVGKEDAAVHAVYSGVVAYADPLKGYGNVVILDHGGDYYSVYGRLQKLWVSTGKRIGKGESIGQVAGAAGHLYFEIRHRSRAQDPLAWLPKRS